jgi:hypothetical protein
MSKLSLAAVFLGRQYPLLDSSDREDAKQRAFARRMDRYVNRRNAARAGAVMLVPQHLDAKLLEEGKAFEAAWAHEISTLITLRRRNSPEAEAAARAARAVTALLAKSIEMTAATTLDGFNVQARVMLWRVCREPLCAWSPEMTPDAGPGASI